MEGSGSDTLTSTTDTRYREAGKDIANYERQRQAQSCGHRKTERGGTEETERQTEYIEEERQTDSDRDRQTESPTERNTDTPDIVGQVHLNLHNISSLLEKCFSLTVKNVNIGFVA